MVQRKRNAYTQSATLCNVSELTDRAAVWTEYSAGVTEREGHPN